MFADLLGFPRMCFALTDGAAVEMLNGFFTQVDDIAGLHEGIISGVVAGSGLVNFNMPTPHPATVRRINRALTRLEGVASLRCERLSRNGAGDVGV
jgi:class 3 adenylate cyclase